MFGYSLVNTPEFNIDTKVIDNVFTSISKIVEQDSSLRRSCYRARKRVLTLKQLRVLQAAYPLCYTHTMI